MEPVPNKYTGSNAISQKDKWGKTLALVNGSWFD